MNCSLFRSHVKHRRMSVSTGPVLCGKCKRPLHESANISPHERAPCPTCNSTIRIFNIEARATVPLRTKVGFKHKRPGFKKPIYEEIRGEDFHRNSGRWNWLLRVIDRKNDRYRETIVHPETGEVLRSVDEPSASTSVGDRPRSRACLSKRDANPSAARTA